MTRRTMPVLVALSLGAAAPVWAQETGQELFLRHCALCHGADGRGGGPLADAMKTVPSDLTRIAIRHDGQYPADKVADVIRNGGGVLGHGSSAMLPWGAYFSEKGDPSAGRRRVKELVRYIESIQAK